MEKKLLSFVHALRHGGLKVSPGELMDALTSIATYGIEDPEQFYILLKATLVKSETDGAIFDLAFRLFFREEAEKPGDLQKPDSSTGFGTSTDGSGTGKAGMGRASRALYEAVTKGHSEDLISMAEKILSGLDMEEDRVDQLLFQLKVKMEWFMVENALERGGEEGQENLQLLKDLEQYIRYRIEKILVEKKGDQGLKDLLTEENLMEKDFAALNEFQVKEMEKRVARLAHQLASRYSYRFKASKSGRVDMRRVLRKAARLGRTPEKLLYRDKVMNKPSMIVLCDISGSVSVYSAFLLQLVYAMSRRFHDLKAFLFVDEIAEITAQIKTNHMREGIGQAITQTRCSRLGISNFGQVFELFNQNFGHILDRKTTVIILGDAKNNWYPPRQEELKLIAQKAKQVYWLNPEPKEKWNQDDSIIGLYGKYCQGVMECRNLDQLEQAVRKIM
ncbi:vWA domain-containing protein [Dehalobacterium formicoaceticum]|uniref:VWA domain-containing protein n=1 Tax=Dehalobacterium formicoaceticum TaxID=51515 RepID=A0ABT1Y405_9FIRM|nr:VWA domain-containing protein [Dehalobacterium formicoaceticum]MCR6545601.1 VWA domain-containing protein [Dehalobacterium formicoaceticum]